jgi:cysteine desulfurase
MRAGTENLYGIVGFAKALELASANFEKDSQYIRGIKQYMFNKLRTEIADVSFNGDPEGSSLYTVLSVNFPRSEKSEMLLFNLDINNICASGGSACTSGVETSHVIKALGDSDNKATVRFSFSKFNTRDQVEHVIEKLKGLI